MASPRRPTLRSLAAEAGVSVTTMSFALRDSSEISAATRERLQRLARARGYRANPLVTALFSQVRRHKPRGDYAVIAYLNTWWPRPLWETCTTKPVQYRGAAKRAAELGFRLESFWTRDPGMTSPRLAAILRARGIRAVLVGPLQNQEQPFEFAWNDFTFAAIAYSLHEPVLPRACHAHFRGMYRAMNELIARGYRRIGYVTTRDMEERVNSLWGAAYRFNQHRLAARHRIELLAFDGEIDIHALKRWLRATRPDAVTCALPRVYEMIVGLGYRVPEELGFVHLDLSAQLREAKVAGIDQLSEIVGAAAVDLIASQLYTNSAGVPEHPVTHLVEGRWYDGQTIRPLAAAVPTKL